MKLLNPIVDYPWYLKMLQRVETGEEGGLVGAFMR